MASRIGAMTDDEMDNQNRQMTEFLSQKVSRLKSIAFDMETETRDHVRLLNNLDDDFDGTKGFLSGSMMRVDKMISRNRGNRKIMCYTTLILVVIFFLCYYTLSHAFK